MWCIGDRRGKGECFEESGLGSFDGREGLFIVGKLVD